MSNPNNVLDDKAHLVQVAALCARWKKNGKPEILIITSRETGRWIIPKGWPMRDNTFARAAQIEAWEEAGVVTRKSADCPEIGQFQYTKRYIDKRRRKVQVHVFLTPEKKQLKKFPERGQRTLKWVSLRKAEKLLSDPSLVKLIKSLRKTKALHNHPASKGSVG